MIDYEKDDRQFVEMVSGFFDKIVVANCSLDKYDLTMVQTPDGTTLGKEVWEDIFLFNTVTKVLTIKEYGGLPFIGIDQANLMFQSTIENELSHPYHLVTVIPNRTLVLEESPQFTTDLKPIMVIETFKVEKIFEPISYFLPKAADPFEFPLIPITIIN